MLGILSRGGMTTADFLISTQYQNLKVSPANIVILLLGGNDLDSDEKPEQVCKEIYTIYKELRLLGKSVFVCESPKRYSTRVCEFELYEQKRKCLSRLLSRALKNRFITLPSNFFDQDCFKSRFSPQWGMEYVHLKQNYYDELGHLVLKHIQMDLINRSSLPSRINPY